jgi:hypothetical protein
MQAFCVGHRPLAFDPGREFRWVARERLDDRETILVPDDQFGPAYDGRILSEYTQLFGLAEELASADPTEELFLFQYRKFVTLRRGSVRSTNRAFAFAASPSEAARLFPGDDDLARSNGRTLVGPRLAIGNQAEEYAHAHVATDFVHLTAALSLVEGFTEDRCRAFAANPFLVASPAQGLYRVETFLRHMRILREAWAAFYPFYVPRQRYQRRVGGFLLERLHSFLVLEEARRGRIHLVHGHQIIVSDTPEIVLTV